VTGYWNVFEDGDVGAANGEAYVRDSDGLTLAVNAMIETETHRHGMVYVDLYTPFKDKGNDTTLLATDGDHPSAAGHALITTLLHTALLTAPR
jgi:lysophospholipase L1-like esterase